MEGADISMLTDPVAKQQELSRMRDEVEEKQAVLKKEGRRKRIGRK